MSIVKPGMSAPGRAGDQVQAAAHPRTESEAG